MVSKAALAAAEARAASAAKMEAASTQLAASTLEKVTAIATKKIQDMEKNSKFFAKDSLDVIPKFAADELSLGKVLGKGGFGTVKEIRSINCKDTTDLGSNPQSFEPGDDEQAKQDRKFIADHCLRDGGDARYCIKVRHDVCMYCSARVVSYFYFNPFITCIQALSPEVIADKGLFTQGVIDMSVETMFLSVVSHPHIITMRAFGSDGMLKPNYFIVLDRLYDTLEARIPKWKVQSKRARSFVNKLKKNTSSKLDELMETKLSYAYDLAGAFEYLHKNK